jgi:hypothetical protein
MGTSWQDVAVVALTVVMMLGMLWLARRDD